MKVKDRRHVDASTDPHPDLDRHNMEIWIRIGIKTMRITALQNTKDFLVLMKESTVHMRPICVAGTHCSPSDIVTLGAVL